MEHHLNNYHIADFTITNLSYAFILKQSTSLAATSERGFFELEPKHITINNAAFIIPANSFSANASLNVLISQFNDSITLSCTCSSLKKKLCDHQVQVLYNIMNREELRIFFDEKIRLLKIRQSAKDYGLENEPAPEQFFELEYADKAIKIAPKNKALFPVNSHTKEYLENCLLPLKALFPVNVNSDSKMVIVVGKHRHYNQLNIELLITQTSKEGRLKNPFAIVKPMDILWKITDAEELKFFTGILKFQNNYTTDKSESDFSALQAIIKNPLKLDFFYHDAAVSEKMNTNSLLPIQLNILNIALNLFADKKENFYEISGKLVIDHNTYALHKIVIKLHYFIAVENTFYLITNNDLTRIINFFKTNPKLLIYESKFEDFKQDILSKLESKVRITYAYIQPATKTQLKEIAFEQSIKKFIYLSENSDYIFITPVINYGDIEIPVLSKKQIYLTDKFNNAFSVERNNELEDQFTGLLLRQHIDFKEQLYNESFYLHKTKFSDNDWFLEAFEAWSNQGITVFGLNEIQSRKINPSKAKINISVNNGINWFDTLVDIHYGKQKVSLKQLQKAIRNKSRFVLLDDGKLGILPKEWMERLTKYLNAGEVDGDSIRTAKSNFTTIAEIYDAAFLTSATKKQIAAYKKKFADFKSIKKTSPPQGLKASLRDYQKEGLNWLCFLDEFDFGGCLADDMGLGKTIQVIALLLKQREEKRQNTNLVVVPTSLIFNWQQELAKFAPSIHVLTIHGNNRVKQINNFNNYEVVLTTYGTILTDIIFLKKYFFNYIILDESQAIKNPESQRYKAVCSLQSRNRIAITGTPIENNTFDLYGQLSFTCPGLLGTKQQFKDHYFTPIDTFSDGRRLAELQKKIDPFLLRRTKIQVVKELPEKTEMILYCEMGTEQRKVYDTFEKEFREYIIRKQEQDLPKDTMYVLKGITKLRQICDSPALINDQEFYGNYSSKIEVLIQQIESKSAHHKILIFSQFVGMLDLIKKDLDLKNIPYQYLTGKTTNRAGSVDAFQTNEAVRVFLISLKAGGTGLNLTAADYVYLIDPWWNPAVENQAIDRCYRIGQKKNVVAVRLICPNTIEEKIMKLQETKKELANDLIKTDTSILKSLSKEKLLQLLT